MNIVITSYSIHYTKLYDYVVATEDGTSVEINGTVTTLQRGEQLGYKLEDPATYITSNNPVYAYP